MYCPVLKSSWDKGKKLVVMELDDSHEGIPIFKNNILTLNFSAR